MTPERLREILEASGLTQRQAAERLGVNKSTLTRWLSGQCPISQANATLIKAKLRSR